MVDRGHLAQPARAVVDLRRPGTGGPTVDVVSETTGDCEARRALPTGPDVLVSFLVLVLALLPFAIGRRSEMLSVDPRWALVSLSVVGAAVLLWRRRDPWPVWALVTLLGLVAVGVGRGPTTAYVPAVVALFNVSSIGSTVRVVVAALVSGLSPVVVILLVGRDGAFDALAFGTTAWSGVALMSGIAVRNARAVVAAAHERARLAELNRDEEAQRRVAEERLRIARELHDVMAHHVAVINVQAGVAGHLVRTDPEGAAAAMTHVRQASQTVLHEVSAILGLLRSGEEGLVVAPTPRFADLGLLVEQTRRAGIEVVCATTGTVRELAPGVDLTAYRVVQEALTNASRHGSGEVAVDAVFAADELVLSVRNRCAHPVAAPGRDRHGLTGMRERAEAVGGTLTAGPDGPGWWLVQAQLPVASRDVEATAR